VCSTLTASFPGEPLRCFHSIHAAAECTLVLDVFHPVRASPANSLDDFQSVWSVHPFLRSLPFFRYIALATGAAARVLQLPLGGGGGPLATSSCPGNTMSSSTPKIRVYESQHYSLPHHHRPASAAVAMAIPRAREEVPPPLPPPRHIEDLRAGRDPGWQWGNTNSPSDTGFGGNRLATVKPGSSLYGGSNIGYPSPRDPTADHVSKNRESSVSHSFDDMSSENSAEHNSDEDRSVKSRPSLGNHR
jgi:hypothetical protein